MLTAVFTGLIALLGWATFRYLKSKRSSLPLPPGPPPLPIVGNLFNNPINAFEPWKEYAALAQKYGDIIYFNVLGQSVVVLSSTKAASDLFEKRSAIYSSRSRTVMIHDLMDLDWFMSFMPYTEKWRKTRRAFHQYFHAGVIDKYEDIQLQEAQLFLRRLLEAPKKFFRHIQLSFASTITRAVYDMEITSSEDPYVDMASKGFHGIGAAGQPGNFLVDSLPFLKYIPAWFPGAHFRQVAAESKYYMSQVRDLPFDYVKEQIKAGTAGPSIVLSMLDKIADSPDKEEQEVVLRDAAGIAYIGGADTTISSVQCWFLAMTAYPEVQKKAKAELDAVVGPNRLPEFADRSSLPYIEAMVKETLRWQLVTPMAVPHLTTEDDEYRGYFIPKGTVVIGNGWAMMHDPVEYPNPDEFRPERFLTEDGQLNPKVQDPEVAVFGFGRRICPGRAFAINSLFIQIASILHTFDISPALDKNGEPVTVDCKMTSGIISYPLPYTCTIKCRSSGAEALVNGSV